MNKYYPLLLLFLCITVVFGSCSKTESIQIAGSTTVLPVVSQAAEAYKSANAGLNIIVNAGGSGVGINQLGEGKIDIGMTSRDITDQEKSKYSDIEFTLIPIATDAVVPVVSSEIYESGVTGLSLQQIGKIYKGDITNWSELGGPERQILVVDKETSRGTRHVFMKAVLGDKEAQAPGADLVLGANNEEQTAITQSDAAIGMLSMPWLNNDVKGLSILSTDGSIIDPSLENVVNGSFPITRSLYVITNGDKSVKVKDFIDFLLGEEGQKIAQEEGYVSIQS